MKTNILRLEEIETTQTEKEAEFTGASRVHNSAAHVL
jgi:hypothetical protein